MSFQKNELCVRREYNKQINFSIDQEMAIFVDYDLQWKNRIDNDGLTHNFSIIILKFHIILNDKEHKIVIQQNINYVTYTLLAFIYLFNVHYIEALDSGAI